MAQRKSSIQYAALPYIMRDGNLQVMLITSRETRRWVIPKGWPEKSLQPHQVAEHEAFEEAGLVGIVSPHAYASFEYRKRLENGKRRLCTVEVFPLLVTEELADWPEKSQRKRKWMTPGQAALRVAEVQLVEMLEKLSALTDPAGTLAP